MALGRYDINFILRTTDRTGNTMRTVARDMGLMTKQAKLTRAAFTAMDVGRGLQLRGLLGGAALGVAAQQAATFESSVSKAATQVAGDNNVQQIAQNTIKLHKEILGLMGEFPASAEQQAAAAYDIFSAMNVPLEKGVALLKLFNMVAVAGATDLETASDAMITILNNFGGTYEQVMKSVNTSFAIIRFGKMEFSEFNTMLQSVVPAAKGAGQSLQDVGGAMAFLSTRMKPAQAATALSRLLEVIARPDFRNGARKLGLDIEDMSGRLLPLPKIIDELARLPVAKVQSTINSLIPMVTAVGRGGGRGVQSTIQSRRALVQMVQGRADYLKIQNLTLQAQQEFEKRYTTMIGTAGVRWEKFKASMQAVLIMLGAAAIPLFERFGKVVGNAVAWVRQNEGLIKFTAKAIFAISVGSLLMGTFLKLASSVVLMVNMFGSLAKVGPLAYRGLMWVATAFSLIRMAGLKALPVIFMNLGALSKLAKLGIITTTIIVLWEVHKKKGWNEFWKSVDEKILAASEGLEKLGPGGQVAATGIQAVINLDKKTRIKNLEDLKRQAKTGKGSNDDVAKEVTSNYQKIINQIKKELGGTGKEIFTAKMLKDMGFDPKSLNEALNKLFGTREGGGVKIDDKTRIAQEIAKQTKDLLDQAATALMQVYDGFKQANEQAFGSIFEPIEGEGEEAQLRKAWNWTGGANNLYNTMKERLAQFRKWRGMLNMLLKKGFSKDFVEEFKKMGPEGMKHLSELQKAGPKRVKQFNAMFAAGKGAVTKATEIDFNAQLKKWNSFGKDTALKIILGMESEEQGVQRRMVNMVHRMYTGVATQIATDAVMLQEAANAAAAGLDLTPFMAVPATATGGGKLPGATGPGVPGGVAAAGIGGKYAIPSAATGGLPITAVQALGGRGAAMAAAWARRMAITPDFQPRELQSYTFNVNGTFLTEEESMRNAIKQAAHRTKNRR